MDKLFAESDSDNDEVSFKTENTYAKQYDAWREKEELHKLEQKYGNKPQNSELEDSSDSEDESDEPLEVSEKMEVDFLKTLSLLKTKDPRIYDPTYNFFENVDKGKDTETDNTEVKSKTNKPVSSLAAAFADSDSEDENGEIFKIEKKSPETEQKEDVLKNYLMGKTESGQHERDLAPLKALWSDPKLNEGEAFLRDYILNKRYLDKGPAETAHGKLLDDETLEADEEQMEEQGKFERAYNFRFEEPDQEYLKRYPRTMNYIRPKDDRRTRKRTEVRARKDEEKKRKMEEIARLKALKLKEIQEKIAKIKEVTGNQELAFKDEDIEGDFDPEEHDRRMKAIFDQEYYEDTPDADKPVFPDLDEELEIENWEKYEDGHLNDNAESGHCEDQDFNMDADYDPVKSRKNLMEEIKETLGKKRRNRKRKSKLAEVLLTDKPKFVPVATDKCYADYMEEYYKMDCEDVIGGDLPTRFKYRDVVPNSFGLSIEEILLADDKDLNQWASLKKTVKYRPDNVEKGEVKTYEQKASDLNLKKKLLPSLFKEVPEEPELVVAVDNQKKKKKKKKKNRNSEKSETQVQHEDIVANNDKESPKKKDNNKIDPDAPESSNIVKLDSTDENNLVKPKKKKNKHKQQSNGNILNVSLPSNDTIVENVKKKKKLKRKLTLEDGPEMNIKKRKTTNETEMNENNTFDNSNTIAKGSHKNKKLKSSNATPKEIGKKMKHSKDSKNDGAKRKKNKEKFKNKKQEPSNVVENPLTKLSDERLKAYGLNPKKYRGFLKYKKF